MTDASAAHHQIGQLNLCLVAHLAYGALSGAGGHIGGVERQTSTMARWLAARGHRISLMTWDEGQPDGVAIDGVRVLKVCRQQQGLRGVRFFHPRWTSLNTALKRADADIYYHNCGEYVTGQVAWWCRRHSRAFVYSVASDPDCDPSLPLMRTVRERVLYRYGLRHADRVIVQTCTQRRALALGFQRESEVIPMPCLDRGGAPARQPPAPPRVLWIGRLRFVKRPDRVLALAAACPDVTFDVIGPSDESEYAQRTLQQAAHVRNIRVHGSVSRDEIDRFYRQASCLCCTSDVEGFPNTFIEAWSHGVPVVSMRDPDDLIRDHGLGVAAADVAGLVTGIRAILDDERRWRDVSARARRYYLANHTMDAAMARFERVFADVAASINPGAVLPHASVGIGAA